MTQLAVGRVFQRHCGLAIAVLATIALAGCSSSTAPPSPAAAVAPRAGANSEIGTEGESQTIQTETGTTAQTDTNSQSTADAEQAGGAVPVAAKAQAGREPIYDPTADAHADIQAALARAADGHKRVLVKFGGNWCGWCFRLHDEFKKNPEIAPIIRDEYELVLVDINTNQNLLNEYDKDDQQHSYPWLTVLDADGQVLVNQNTGDLEDGPKHDPRRVKDFLVKWRAEPLDAEQVLASGLNAASSQQKLALVHLGAPSCGWCRVLDRFLVEQQALIGVDYVDVKIDTARMRHGPEVAQRLRQNSSGGIPWIAILDGDGNTLATSDGPLGNIGYPLQPHEIDYFVSMLNQTRQRMTDEHVGEVEKQLRAYAAKRASAH